MKKKAKKQIFTEDQQAMITLIGLRIARNALVAGFNGVLSKKPQDRVDAMSDLVKTFDEEIRGYEEMFNKEDSK